MQVKAIDAIMSRYTEILPNYVLLATSPIIKYKCRIGFCLTRLHYDITCSNERNLKGYEVNKILAEEALVRYRGSKLF